MNDISSYIKINVYVIHYLISIITSIIKHSLQLIEISHILNNT